jgi:hypothetical protein
VDVRKDVEFRFMHGTLNIETITHWLNLLAALIEAGNVGYVSNFKTYLRRREPDLAKEHERRKKALAKADTSRANIWAPKVGVSRAVRRLALPPKNVLASTSPESQETY